MKIDIPHPDVPVVLSNGRINPVWYEKLKLIFEKRALADLIDVDASGIANGEVLVWNSTTEAFEPGTN